MIRVPLQYWLTLAFPCASTSRTSWHSALELRVSRWEPPLPLAVEECESISGSCLQLEGKTLM
jgi:hypothetical protein